MRLLPSGHSTDYYIKVYDGLSKETLEELDKKLNEFGVEYYIRNSKVDVSSIYVYTEDPNIVSEVVYIINQLEGDKEITIKDDVTPMAIIVIKSVDGISLEEVALFSPSSADVSLLQELFNYEYIDVLFKDDDMMILRTYGVVSANTRYIFDIDLNKLRMLKVVLIDPETGFTNIFPREGK